MDTRMRDETQDIIVVGAGIIGITAALRLQASGRSVRVLDRNDGKSRVFSSWMVVLKYMIQTTTLCIANMGTRPTK